ncbi:hypothetical protein PIB30_040312 [Stylosanthes scabra]|uniref:Uncharacterized protein n=1 Tax=Stylosanthes scabra TaxID=79078 RepID=A0ABU6REL6_9FABA|nr:hypothetical protein [Stylosanthes scabra]
MARTKYVNNAPLPAPRTRRARAASQADTQREASPFSEEVFDSRENYERSNKVFPRGMTVFLWGKQIPFTEDSLHDFLGINVPPPTKEEDAYEQALVKRHMGTLDLNHVLATIAMPGMRWDSYNPKFDIVDNAILIPEARGWQRMIVCNM